MEESEYNERLKKIETDFEQSKKRLYLDYGMSNAIFNKGDIIKDSRWVMLIERITVSKSFGLPQPVYTGTQLKKDLSPRLDRTTVSIYGNDCELVKSAPTLNPTP